MTTDKKISMPGWSNRKQEQCRKSFSETLVVQPSSHILETSIPVKMSSESPQAGAFQFSDAHLTVPSDGDFYDF